MIEWTEMDAGKMYVGARGERRFRLKREAAGVLGMGTSFYLTTKLASETQWEDVAEFVVSGDNNGLVGRRSHKGRYWTLDGKEYGKPDIEAMKSEAEKLADAIY